MPDLQTDSVSVFIGDNGRYCGFAVVAKIGESIFDANYFRNGLPFVATLRLYLRSACADARSDLGQPCFA
jgi:hypothetical protein